MKQVITKLGRIVVNESGWKDYPGVWVSLVGKNKEKLVEVLLEVDQYDETPECKVHVYDWRDEPIEDYRGRMVGSKIELEKYNETTEN